MRTSVTLSCSRVPTYLMQKRRPLALVHEYPFILFIVQSQLTANTHRFKKVLQTCSHSTCLINRLSHIVFEKPMFCLPAPSCREEPVCWRCTCNHQTLPMCGLQLGLNLTISNIKQVQTFASLLYTIKASDVGR